MSSFGAIAYDRYAPVRDAIGAGAPDAPAHMKFLAGAITGAVGSIAGNRKYLNALDLVISRKKVLLFLRALLHNSL